LRLIVRIFVGLSIALMILWVIGQAIGFVIGVLWTRRRSRYYFERRLRRNGIPGPVIEEMGERYHAPGLIRDLIRSTRVEARTGG
jgi:hypothetical protein